MNPLPPPVPPRVSGRDRLIALLWPSFVLAAVATGLFFAAVDPAQLMLFGRSAPLPPLAAYSIGFLCAWGFSAVSIAAGLYFALGNPPPPPRDD